MAVQIGIGTFLGSDGGVTGYCDDSGRGLIRMKSSLDKAKWRRLPSMAGSREAARYFGAASSIAAGIWRNVPAGLKRIMDSGAFNRLVGAVRGALGEDGNVWDFSGLEGIDLNEGSLAEIILNGDLMRDEPFESLRGRGEMRVGQAAIVDERLRMKDESSPGVVSGGRYLMAHRFLGEGVVCCAPTDENLGAMADLKAGLATVRAAEGKLVRRRRIWVQVCEVGTVEVAGASVRFLLVQRGTRRLGRAGWVGPWMLSAEEFDARLAAVRDGDLGFELPLGCGTGIYVVIVGTEVVEKRGRHWVRMPYCCEVGVVECLNQNSQNRLNQNLQNSQDCLNQNLQNSQNCLNQNLQNSLNSQNRLNQNSGPSATLGMTSQDFQNGVLRSVDLQDLEVAAGNGESVDLRGDGMVLEFKDLRGGFGVGGELGFDFRGTGFMILSLCGWIGLGP